MLRVPAFRRLFVVLSLSSIGDWLGLLATTSIAADQVSGTAAKGAAFGGVVVVRLLPALVLAPLAGAVADRFDRRITMIVCDVLRFLLFATIPLVGRITWTLAASFLIEVVAMFWIPAKEASVPNLVRKDQLETANQISLFSTYGLTPVVASLAFASLSTVTRLLAEKVPGGYFSANRVDLALYFNATTFLVSALVVVFIPQISGRRAGGRRPAGGPTGLLRSIGEGWSYVRTSTLVRGLVIGIFGALSAGGFVVGTAKFYAVSLGGGDATFGLLFACLFIGLGVGMGFGPKLAGDLSRRRWFALSIVLAGSSVMLLFAIPFLALAMACALFVGLGAGMAYLSGLTLLGREVDDELRGRVFAFIQSMVRVVLMLATAVSSLLVGLGGQHTVHLGSVPFTFNASRGLLLAGGAMAVTVGVIAFRQLDDKPGVPVIPDLITSLRRRPRDADLGGLFVAFEGGEGTGKSTQAARLCAWLQSSGYDCLVTHEPGGTVTGERVRALLLDPAGAGISARAEALLYAADRADHVDSVVRPALDRGAVVVTDRYVDSSLAYQGAGRSLPVAEVFELSRWATRGLRPDLVILLDLDPLIGLERAGRTGPADRLEAEDIEFHERVRQGFLALASHGGRYLVLDAAARVDDIARQVRERIGPLLTRVRTVPPVTASADQAAGSPADRSSAQVSE